MVPLRLDEARTEVIHIAGIDGKNGANGRHSPTRLNALLNRKYRAYRARVSSLKYPNFITSATTEVLPGRASGEDYQEITLPSTTAELAGVDVQVNGGWERLDPLSFEQRRDAPYLTPPSGVGFWSIVKATTPNTAVLNAGTIAVWPASLAGNYKLLCTSTWSDITNDAHVFMLLPGTEDWLLNAAALVCCSRDKKDSNYSTIERDFMRADALLEASAPTQRGGYTTKTPYRGVCL